MADLSGITVGTIEIVETIKETGSEENVSIARLIDNTNLNADATHKDIEKLCKEAIELGFTSVCVNPYNVAWAAQCLADSLEIMVCTVIGFPLGASISDVKAFETKQAIVDGADKIGMVINVGALKDGLYDLVREEIEAVVNAASGCIVEVIIEATLLTNEEKVIVCLLAKEAGAHFVEISTGTISDATTNDVALMRDTVGKEMGVKAVGGIRDFATAKAMIKAGATSIGTSAGVAIVAEETKEKEATVAAKAAATSLTDW